MMTMLEFSQNKGVSAEGSPSTPVRSVPIAEWTIADRAAWERAIAPRARLCKGGAGAHLAPISQDDLARRYGYFVDHLIRNDLFKPEAQAAGQVTPDHVERFVGELRARVGSVTTANTIHKLRRAAQLLDPNRDFAWLAEIEKDFALMMRPKSKDHRIVDPDCLFEAIASGVDGERGSPLSRRRPVIPL